MLYNSMEALNNEKRVFLQSVPDPRYKVITEQNTFQCSTETVSCYMWEVWQTSEAEWEIISWKATTWEKNVNRENGVSVEAQYKVQWMLSLNF